MRQIVADMAELSDAGYRAQHLHLHQVETVFHYLGRGPTRAMERVGPDGVFVDLGLKVV